MKFHFTVSFARELHVFILQLHFLFSSINNQAWTEKIKKVTQFTHNFEITVFCP